MNIRYLYTKIDIPLLYYNYNECMIYSGKLIGKNIG